MWQGEYSIRSAMKTFRLIIKMMTMKYALLGTCLFFCVLASSQEIIIHKDIPYSKAVDRHNNQIDLRMDIMYPSAGKRFPLIIYVHGGGFVEGRSKEFPTPFCMRLAKEGFVVANVDYRGGFDSSGQNYKTEIAEAVYRAQQDQLAALHFLLGQGGNYPLDTSLVFLAGESAGGITSLFSAYVRQGDWDRIAPLSGLLGPVAPGEELQDISRIRGVISMWGGIADTSFISRPEMRSIPALLFHSVDDETVPFELSTHPEARNKLLEGSRDIANRFRNNHGCYQLYYIKGAAHAYGFSSDYLARAINRFVNGIRSGRCQRVEVENKGSTTLYFNDPEK